MYVARFKIEEKEPQRLYFSVRGRETKQIQFKVERKEPIKFKISNNFNMNVE